MKIKLFLIGILALPVCIIQAADNVIVLKANDGKEITLGPELINQSGTLKDMLESGMLAHQEKNEAGNPVLEFKELTGDQLELLLSLLQFANLHSNFIKYLLNQDRKTYDLNIEGIALDFRLTYLSEGYSDRLQHFQIFELAELFDIPLVIQVMGQVMISPELDLERLEEHNDPIFNEKRGFSIGFQDSIARQLKRRIDLAKERFWEDEDNIQDPYFKGFSVQDLLDHDNDITRFIAYRIITNGPELNLSSQNLVSLKGIEQLINAVSIMVHQSITVVHLSDNKFTTIPDNIYGLDDVQMLKLDNNDIEVIPDKIEGWNNLRYLDLSKNKITRVPSNITGLENLDELSLDNNQIKEFPATIHGLENLRFLRLNYNEITKIPGIIVGLDGLETIMLHDNQIIDVPDDIVGLRSLKTLNLQDNPVSKSWNLNNIKPLIENLSRKRSHPVKVITNY